MNGNTQSRVAAWLLGPLVATAGSALAQTAPPQREPRVDDIVVTAQKRTERLQDVPLSASVVTGQKLEEMGVQNFENFEVPAVRVSRGGMSDSITVRGIGSGQNLGFEQSAPLYIDGIFYGRARLQRLAFLDLQQIEVLKGPQPTFLGKNAIAGAVTLTTRAPGREYEGTGEVSYEFETEEKVAFGAVTVPFGDRLRARVAGKYRDSEGYLTNTVTGRKEPQVEDILGRFVLVAEPTDAIEAKWTVYGGTNTDLGRNNQSTLCTPAYRRNISSLAAEPCIPDDRKASFGENPPNADQSLFFDSGDGSSFFNELEVLGSNFQVDWDVGNGLAFTSLTGWYEFENRLFIDPDQGPVNLLTTNVIERFQQISQEFRLASPVDRRFSWFGGVYLDTNFNKQRSQTTQNNANALPGSPLRNQLGASSTSQTNFTEDATSWAVFGEGKYALTDKVNVKLGVRYEEVEKDNRVLQCDSSALYSIQCAPATVEYAEDSIRNTKWQPAVTLEYRPTDAVLLYGSVKEGFKSGGFSGDGSGAFEPEEVTSYEVGAKSTLFDDRVLFNIAAFRGDYSDLQVSSFDPATNLFTTGNAAEARTQGVEVESQWVATQNLRFAASVAYLDAEFTDYPDAQCYPTQTVAQGCGASGQDLTGTALVFAPEWSGAVSATYERDIGWGLVFSTTADVNATTKYNTLQLNNPNTIQEGYTKLNARISIGSADNRWNLALIGRNLNDELTAAFKNTIPSGAGSIATFTDPPRTIALQLRTNW